MAVRIEMRLELHAVTKLRNGAVYKTEKIDDVWCDVADVPALRANVPAGFVYVTPTKDPTFRVRRKV